MNLQKRKMLYIQIWRFLFFVIHNNIPRQENYQLVLEIFYILLSYGLYPVSSGEHFPPQDL